MLFSLRRSIRKRKSKKIFINLLSGKILFVENPYKSTTFYELKNAINVGEQLILEFNLKVEVCIVVDTDTIYSLKNACSNKS
jgi:hypothetical protein